ncbi:MAG: hypothetical protein AB2A00_33545 [Myxococcota bacterium]
MKRLPIQMGTLAGLLAVGLTAACGNGTEDPGAAAGGASSSSSSTSSGGSSSGGSSGNLHVVRAETNGALNGSDLGAALQWHAYNQELLDCLAPIVVEPPLDLEDPDDHATLNQLGLCAHLHAYGRVAAEGVPLDPSSNSFEVPITEIPEPALLTVGESSEFGLGAVVVFRDGNGNARLDMVTPGAQESVDTILGASVAVDESAVQDMLVLYRNGELSPLWKLFQGLYDCTVEPPQGFSILKVTIDDMTGLFNCTILTEGTVEVALRNSPEMRSLICLPGAEGPPYRYPEEPLPADAVAECFGMETVYFTTTPDSVCPIVERYDLIGCSDPSSPEACRASIWDITGNPPSWWPCTGGGGDGASVALVDEPGDVTDGQDILFTLEHRGGTLTIPVDALRVDVVVDETGRTVTLGAESITLVDNDENTVFSAGDALLVAENGVNLFGSLTEPGNYPVTLLDTRTTPPRQVSSQWWVPRALPPPLDEQPIQLVIEDDPAPLTENPDVLFTARFDDVMRSLPISDIRVDVMDGCEPPVTFAGTQHLSLVSGDDDTTWETGELLRVQESADVHMWFTAPYHFTHCVSVSVRRGFNYYEHVAWGAWSGAEVALEDAPGSLTAGADILFTVTMVAGHAAVPLTDLQARIYRYIPGVSSEEIALLTAASGAATLTTDRNGDGRFGRDDVLTVREVEPVAGLAEDAQDLAVYLEDSQGNMVGYASWTSGAQ